ncbi:hypothetical protein NGUA16_04034 [Salmonella enterica]|nr:hypothetical protein NGUA16_04034 [Salmonella enterica]
MSGLFSARLRFTRFTGRDDGAIVWQTTRLNNHRLRGLRLFLFYPRQRSGNGILIFCRWLYRCALVTCKAGGFFALQSCLTSLKTCFGFGGAFFFKPDRSNLRFFLTEILDERNITRADPGAGAAFYTISNMVSGSLVMLLPFAEPIKLLR